MMRSDLIWIISALATAGVIIRPWNSPEAIWAVFGAASLLVCGLLPWSAAVQAIGSGTDVYLFLIGMMLLSETAGREGLFDWLAAWAVRRANGSATRLFLLIYAVGAVVTAFLSNDATAVVMTPAVLAATKAARVEPLPYLFICAFIANAASFVLPISNPANLVVFAAHMPPLFAWLGAFAIPSILSITVTLVALLWLERAHLRPIIDTPIDTPIDTTIDTTADQPLLSKSGKTAAAGIAVTAIALMAASAVGLSLGLPTMLAGLGATGWVLVQKKEAPWPVLRGVSWSVLPLVAGLFVLVEAVKRTALLGHIVDTLHQGAHRSVPLTAWGAGTALAFLCNGMNNLPAGLVAGSIVTGGHLPQMVTNALLIGVDLGPNLSITGSLATILWLIALRRGGLNCGFGQFLARGIVVMPLALACALAGLLYRGFAF